MSSMLHVKACSFSIILYVIALSVDLAWTGPIEQNPALDFIILHNNDMHSRFEQTDRSSGKCSAEDAAAKKCYGGFARVSHVVKKYREEAKNGGPAVLYLNAGDTYVGTPWFSVFKHKVCADFMNILRPDAMSLGNHELDKGVDSLVPFLKAVQFPVLTANIDNAPNHPLWQTGSLKKSIVLDVKGFKIGVIGYLTPETKELTMKSDVEFVPEITAINKEAGLLKEKGVKIIIALGHSGYVVDQEIAKSCPLVDVVVGGHSHSFLYSGQQPDTEVSEGPYPTIVTQSSGKEVPVVQAYAFTKYIGALRLNFDADGNLLHWSGQPILLDDSIPRDPEVAALEDVYRPQVNEITEKVIGITKVRLDGSKCRTNECNIGNFISDAFVNTRIRQYNGTDLTDAPIAIMASGDIRASGKIGKITRFDLETIIPFENQLIAVNITGRVLQQVLEHSVRRYIEYGPPGEFLQLSGMHVVYNISNPSGNRVVSANVLCSTCLVPLYENLDPNRQYGIIISSFLYDGGDGFTMFKDLKATYLNTTVQDAVQKYIQNSPVIYPSIEGRIKVYKN
ncbi:protein 5NUC-like [Sitodiplosis mosellana]|uniref:protein 5NUC-like n=1 Tax=Sitodiplosis mosellana TaxID=263140 RepID=UPI0024448868|nr:protein 5NUC-like [Sitodiplosis mosellana]XP_055295863.1 protein 5NUC-like [Sitodiplosis mosellana]